ncbi:ATP-binding cassette domain-containing protein [Arthrobacter sp. KNU40]|uniref:ATP-binding cassette domain-containing protein n=1 Tax=Arthrobacter sp. KNU40 TaxID=3447965 RepID=UPI003F62A02D
MSTPASTSNFETTTPPDGETRTGPNAPALALQDVAKTYGAVHALTGVSFEVFPGEVHALVGENGAGKSTLVGIASGALPPTHGSVAVGGQVVSPLTPRSVADLGVAVVRQIPNLLPDLTVAQNMYLAKGDASPYFNNQQTRRLCADLLDPWGMGIDPDARVDQLSMQQRFVVEIAKALASKPRVLLLDEPTEHLNKAEITRLFSEIRALRDSGVGVVYISHRLGEVREISDRVTVLRDGAARAAGPIDAFSNERMIDLMAGRSLSLVMPQKRSETVFAGQGPVLEVNTLTAPGCDDISLRVLPGEILGLAGIAGSGQDAILRALAGLTRASGEVRVNDRPFGLGSPVRARSAGISYIPSDRATEGLLLPLSIQDNLALGDLGQVSVAGVVRDVEVEKQARADVERFAVRTPSPRTVVGDLSGGNQQKVVFARTIRPNPKVLLADEPTQGVDAKTRSDLYHVLRERAARGDAVVVVASDALEIAGLCDRVLIISRGQIEKELQGPDVTEQAITSATVLSATTKVRVEEGRRSWLSRVLRADYGPTLALLIAILALAAYTQSQNSAFLSGASLMNMMALAAPLMLVAIGQAAALMAGAFDLSIGPSCAVALVVGSFILSGSPSPGQMVIGFLAMAASALVVGLVNSTLILGFKMNAFVATLVTYVGLQGLGNLLRPSPDGYFGGTLITALSATVGFIPVSFAVLVLVVAVAELVLRRTRSGLSLLASGSDASVADRIGLRRNRRLVAAFMIAAVTAFGTSVLLVSQIGVGDPNVGTNYTLASVAAAVVGGTSVFGGRGSFVGASLGAVLLVEITAAAAFLQLSPAWQLAFQGLLIVAGASMYARTRGNGGRA